jgi:undecaprenyl phosphate-alpha-L-ara4FN deformylase
MIHVGLRVDVDTLRGTRIGVPNLTALLKRRHVRGTFFFSVGPDNMGRHLRRLLRPAFLVKMLRTGAPRLYGWDILLRGTLWPGPVIADRCKDAICKAAGAGHEIGLHAWDHYFWQKRIANLKEADVAAEVRKGFDLLERILGRKPDCFAAPAWRVTPQALHALETFPFRFQSDCRGHSVFRPLIAGTRLGHVQVPVTLPTYDELIGLKCTSKTYNEYLLDLIRPDDLNVLTVHAEAEGMGCLSLFQDFLDMARRRGVVFSPLGELVPGAEKIPEAGVVKGTVSGRDGWLALQEEPPFIPGC